MEGLKNSIEIQEMFEKFKREYKEDLCRFIGYKDNAEFVLDENAGTFYFSPKEKKIGIPKKWLEEYITLLDNNDKSLDLYKLDGKFSLAHEFSHFRDMLKEQDITRESSMYRVLKRLSGRKIKISEKEYIPIGDMIHNIYNSIDDIIVNYEVMNFMRFGINKEMVKTLYQKKLFADYKGQGDGKKLNLDQPVDYSEIPDYTAISYYFLRKKMVPNQKIILSDNLNKILFNEKGQNLPWSITLRKLKDILDDEIEKAKTSRDQKVIKRYDKLKTTLNMQKNKLSQIDNKKIYKLLGCALKSLNNYDISRLSASSLSLDSIINLFTMSKGGDDGHILCILPDLRYQIYEAVFEPIVETLILIHCLYNDLDDGGGNGGGGNGGGGNGGGGNGGGGDDGGGDDGEGDDGEGDDGEGNDGKGSDGKGSDGKGSDGKGSDGKGSNGEGDDGEGDDGEGNDGSGKGSYSRSLTDALNFIEEAAEYNQSKKKEAERKKQSEQIGQSIFELLKDKGISKEDYDFKEIVQKNFLSYIEQITKILYDELYALDIQSDISDVISKKGNLNYERFLKEFSKSFVDGDFSEKSIYDRKRNIDKIKEEFKKLSFYFMIDVSGSTESFKGRNGLLNGIPVSLALAIKNVEKVIQNMSGDPNYNIPIKYIIYTSSVNYFTKDSDLNDFQTELIRVNSAIARISGGTEDRHGWSVVGQSLSEDLKNHPEYIEDIKKGKMKPVVIQIADTDVSDDGVKRLCDIIRKDFGEDVQKALMPKRIILGEERIVEKPENLAEKGGNWSPEYVKGLDGRILMDKDGHKMVRVKEIGVRSKREIVAGIKVLFKNFFGDMILQK